MRTIKYDSAWYFAIKGALFLVLGPIFILNIQGSFDALSFLSATFIGAIGLLLVGSVFIYKERRAKISVIALGIIHLLFALSIILVTIKKGFTAGNQDQMVLYRSLIFSILTLWALFFLFTEWVEAFRQYRRKNAHCYTILLDSLMTLIILFIFGFLQRNHVSINLETNLNYFMNLYGVSFIVAGISAVLTAKMLTIGDEK